MKVHPEARAAEAQPCWATPRELSDFLQAVLWKGLAVSPDTSPRGSGATFLLLSTVTEGAHYTEKSPQNPCLFSFYTTFSE